MIQKNGAPIADKGRLRKIIRKKIVEILKGKTAAGMRVFPNATIPPSEKELPVILVYPRSEPISLLGDAPRELNRALDVAIEIIASGPEENIDLETPEPGDTTLDDKLDDMAEQVEREMSRDETLQSTCDNSILTNTEFELLRDGALPIGSARLTFEVNYTTASPRKPEDQGPLGDFTKNQIEYNISEDDRTREAEDSVDLPGP